MYKKVLTVILIVMLLMPFSVSAKEAVAVYELTDRRLFQEGFIGETEALPVSLQSIGELEAEIVWALENLQSRLNIDKYNLTTSEAMNIFISVVDQHPELFYVRSGTRVYYNPSTGKAVAYDLTGSYAYTDPLLINQRKKAIEEAANAMLASIDNRMSDAEKALVAHDRLIESCKYDLDTSEIPSSYYTDENWKAFRIDGVFIEKKAVCQGYSLAYMYLLSKLDIPVVYVASAAINHAWNLVQIDGKWYHVDVTWDDPVSTNGDIFSYVGHNNFLVSDTDCMLTGHSGWNSAYAANETYQGFWNDVTGGVHYVGGVWYYLTGKGSRGYIAANSGGTERALYTFSGSWAYYAPYDSRIAIYEDRIYFNTDIDIRSIMMDGSDETVLIEPSLGGVGIYGMLIVGDTLYYAVGPSRNNMIIASGIFLGFKFDAQIDDGSVLITTSGTVADGSRFFVAGYNGNQLVSLQIFPMELGKTMYLTELEEDVDRICVFALSGIRPKGNKIEKTV